MMWKRTVLSLLVSMTLSTQALAERPVRGQDRGSHGTGNAGDFIRQDFIRAARLGLDIVAKDPVLTSNPKLQGVLFRLSNEISSMPLYVKDKVYAHNTEVAAVNYRSKIRRSDRNFPFLPTIKVQDIPDRMIIVGETKWRQNDGQDTAKMGIAIHEYMGAAGFTQDITYGVSSALLAYFGKQISSASTAAALQHQFGAGDNPAYAHIDKDWDECNDVCYDAYPRAFRSVGDQFHLNNAPLRGRDGYRHCNEYDSYFEFIYEAAQFARCDVICETKGKLGKTLEFYLQDIQKNVPEQLFAELYKKQAPVELVANDKQSVLNSLANTEAGLRCEDFPRFEVSKKVTHRTLYKPRTEQWNSITNSLVSSYCDLPDADQDFLVYSIHEDKSWATRGSAFPFEDMMEYEKGKGRDWEGETKLVTAFVTMLDNYNAIFAYKWKTVPKSGGTSDVLHYDVFHYRISTANDMFRVVNHYSLRTDTWILGTYDLSEVLLEYRFRKEDRADRKKLLQELTKSSEEKYDFYRLYVDALDEQK